jgi:hypothetical protein
MINQAMHHLNSWCCSAQLVTTQHYLIGSGPRDFPFHPVNPPNTHIQKSKGEGLLKYHFLVKTSDQIVNQTSRNLHYPITFEIA